MFSKHNFSWKRWLALSVIFFAVSWLAGLVVHSIAGDPDNELYDGGDLLRRAVLSAVIALAVSFTRTGPKQ